MTPGQPAPETASRGPRTRTPWEGAGGGVRGASPAPEPSAGPPEQRPGPEGPITGRHRALSDSPRLASTDAGQDTRRRAPSRPSPSPRRKWPLVLPAFLPVHSPPTSGGQVGARRLTTFCADGRQAAASEWRLRPPAGAGGGAGGGLRSRAPRSSGPRSSSCSPPSWRGRPRQVRRGRLCLSSVGRPSRLALSATCRSWS